MRERPSKLTQFFAAAGFAGLVAAILLIVGGLWYWDYSECRKVGHGRAYCLVMWR